MTDLVVIRLDTTPPHVEFGDAGGTTAGEFFQIAYTADEPLARATLVSASGQRLALDVGAVTLSVLLPPDIADGWATIEWADDVGNADQAVPVRLTGTIVQPPQPPPPSQGFPRPDKRPMVRRRRLTARTAIVVTSRTRRSESSRTNRRRQAVTVVARTRRRAQLHREHHLALTTRSSTRTRTRASATAAVASETAIRRRDDPTIEAFLLDLL